MKLEPAEAPETPALVPSLLQAIVRLKGEVVVMHVGERPYVITPAGQVDLATRELTVDSVAGIVNQLLPAALQETLAASGGVRYELPAAPGLPEDRFTIVVAGAAGDIWAEIRHRRAIDLASMPQPMSQMTLETAQEADRETAVESTDPVPDDRGGGMSAPVLPLLKSHIRPHVPPAVVEPSLASLDQLLRVAAARGASMLYLASASRPAIRVDGEMTMLDGAPVFGPNDVESLLLTLMPERSAETLRTGVSSEWMCDVPEVGRVRCLSFRDHHGPGGVFRLMPVRVTTVEQLGLSHAIRSLAVEPEGLVVVAGPRASGKRTLMSALVDLINRTRHDHIISIETEIDVVHQHLRSFVSQREVRGGVEEMHDAARSALREDPDVLVVEELRTSALMNVALEAASSGQLVIGGVPAHDATGAIDRIIDLYPPDLRREIQLSLSQNLRGVVAQVLLRKRDGGRLAAREVLLNTPAVASVLAEGRTSQLLPAIEGGRKAGMVPLNDALAGYVQAGAVDVQEAYRQSADRAAFLALLGRLEVDTSAIERPA